MAGRQRKSIEEQIQIIEESIQSAKGKLDEYMLSAKKSIKEMEEKKQFLIEQKQKEEVQRLYNLMGEQGLSISDLENMITENCKKIG